MGSRLDRITDWNLRASAARFRVALLAKNCGVTERQLHRYFLVRFGSSPREWMNSQRLEQVKHLLLEGKLVKEAAAEAGYNQPSSFTRQFTRKFNAPPTTFRGQ